MAKFLENDNESPEVDLKNLTVKLAGMGLDEEIEDVIPGKKEKKSSKSSKKEEAKDEDTESEKTSDEVEETADESAEETAEEVVEDAAEDLSDSEEVNDYYEKRAAERDLTLEKVEELAEEMESSAEKKQKVSALDTIIAKSEKKSSEEKAPKEKKKGKIDGVAIVGIVLAIAALLGGAFWLYRSAHEEPNLGITMNMFSSQYRNTPIYRSIFSMGFDIPEASYRDEEKIPAATDASADPAAVTTSIDDKYLYFDMVMSGRVQEGIQSPVFITGREIKSNKLIKNMRFYSPLRNADDMEVFYVVYSGFLQTFYTDVDSATCLEKVKNAYNQSVASTDTAVIVKDGDFAYAVTKAEIEGETCFVMDVIAAKDAGKYVFNNKIYSEPSFHLTDRYFRALYYSNPLYNTFMEFGFTFTQTNYHDDAVDANGAPTKFRFFDNVVTGSISMDWPQVTIDVTGCENRYDHFITWLRFSAPIETEAEEEVQVYSILYAAYLQALYTGTDTQTCLTKVKNALNLYFESGSQTPVMLKDGNFAYCIYTKTVDGQVKFVMDVVPVEYADSFNFDDPMKG